MEVPVKRATVLAILVLAGCSADSSATTTTLAPLPTTVIASPSTLPVTDSYTGQQFAFFDDVVYFYGGTPTMDEDAMLEFGELWCQLMEDGMGDTDVVERINEGATDESDRETHFAIVLAGIRNLCPSQSGKAEYISLNAPLP